MSALLNLSLDKLQYDLSTPRQIATQRMRCLGVVGGVAVSVSSPLSSSSSPDDVGVGIDSNADDDAMNGSAAGGGGGLPKILVTFLRRVLLEWSRTYKTIVVSLVKPTSLASESKAPSLLLCNLEELQILQRTLQFIVKIVKMDPTLGEEIVRCRIFAGDCDGSRDTNIIASDYDSIMTMCSRIIEQVNQLLQLCHASVTDIDNHYFSEQDLDALVDLQDVVYELKSLSTSSSSSSSSSSSYYCQSMPFTDDELRSRLPLVYKLKSVHRCHQKNAAATAIYIDQVRKRQSAQVDVGFVMWPSAIVLSRWLISNPHILVTTTMMDGGMGCIHNNASCTTILELGAGCGLVGITAARIIKDSRNKIEEDNREGELCDESGQQQRTQPIVIITDVNDLVLENISRNIDLNDVASLASVSKLDFYAQTGCNYMGKWISSARIHNAVNSELVDTSSTNVENEDRSQDPVDVILAADIICQPEDAIAASKTIYDALRPGGIGYVVCANAEHRYGVEIFESECIQRGLAVTTTDVAEMYDVQLLTSGDMETAAGYIDGMRLTFYEITKTIA